MIFYYWLSACLYLYNLKRGLTAEPSFADLLVEVCTTMNNLKNISGVEEFNQRVNRFSVIGMEIVLKCITNQMKANNQSSIRR